MTMVNFGAGTLVGRRTDITNPTPGFMGILQDVQVDFDQSIKELMGQYKMPVDIAPAALKITGKAKMARIQANMTNDLILGQTLTSASGIRLAIAEPHTVASTTQLVTQAATFKEDMGVYYASNNVQLTRVAPASEATGKYSVNETTGTYTFAVADEVALLFYYSYGIVTDKQIALTNQLMGVGPSFEVVLQESYTNNAGVTNNLFLKLNACRSSKMSWPFKNADYTIQEFDFQAFADQSNNWGTLSFTE